jgi:hypothetical protein
MNLIVHSIPAAYTLTLIGIVRKRDWGQLRDMNVKANNELNDLVTKLTPSFQSLNTVTSSSSTTPFNCLPG